jgi:sensor histidine kinase YesM
MSYSIGICIHFLIYAALFTIKPIRNVTFWGAVVLGAIVGNILGIHLGVFLSDVLLGISITFEDPSPFQVTIFGIAFGVVISFFFWTIGSLSETKAQIQEEKIKRISSEKAALEANLRLLQAQIEPHFLFNTLSNIHSLMDSDPSTAKAMLMDLNQYLRNTLNQTRQQETTLGKEMEVVAAYLKIFKVRMGERLAFSIDLPESLVERAFPPMLLQPLVENAVIHGLEPTVDGGRIEIKARQREGRLVIEVTDTGCGFTSDIATGVGLTNIRERLKLLFADGARLTVASNTPGGVVATIEITDEPSG